MEHPAPHSEKMEVPSNHQSEKKEQDADQATNRVTGVGPTQSIDITVNIGQKDSLGGLRTPFSISKSRSKDGTNVPC